MLIKNITIWNENPLRRSGGAGAASSMERSGFNRTEQCLNRYAGFGGLEKKDAMIAGAQPPYTWSPAITPGGLAAFTSINGVGILTPHLAGGKALASGAPRITGSGGISETSSLSMAYHLLAGLAGAGTITTASLSGAVRLMADLLGAGGSDESQLDLLAWCASAFGGSGDITSATVEMPIPMSATLAGEGGVTAAALMGLVHLLADLEGDGSITPDLRSPASLSGNLQGSGDLQTVVLKAISWCVADIVGQGTLEGSDARGKLFMGANITSAGELVTAQSCAIAVWSALAVAFNEPGSMGNRMNSAASAGDPWTGIMENYQDDATFGAFVKKLLTTNGFFGLR